MAFVILSVTDERMWEAVTSSATAPVIDGSNIVTETEIDVQLSLYILHDHADTEMRLP